MPVQVILGAQWGDEGKGKIVDLLSDQADIVARYQGGANAGHTVVIGEQQYVLHLIPSGMFHPHIVCVIGNGTVIDPVALMSEIGMLEAAGITVSGRLLISHNAHLIMPYHKQLDVIREQTSTKIGTTGRGIGPAYIDKFMRTGIRIVDLLDRETFAAKLKTNIEEKNQILTKVYGETKIDVDAIIAEYQEFDKRIDEYITNTAVYLNQALAAGKTVIAEGAQGALLDVDHGTYPYRDLLQPHRRRRLHGAGHSAHGDPGGDRRGEGLFDTRGERSVSDRARRRRRRGPAEDRRGVRRHDRAAPALRLVRRGGNALQRDGQRGRQDRGDQARRAGRLRRDPDVRCLRAARKAAEALPHRPAHARGDHAGL